ncbi:MAG: hypothetical protein ACTSO7_17340 [Candidatus Heimdallarchaeota archaeon]
MAITTSQLNKKISTDIKENLLSFSKGLLEESTYSVINSIIITLEDPPVVDKELEVSAQLVYDIMSNDQYKEKIEQDIVRNPSHLIDVKKTRTISLAEAILKLNKSNELYDKEWDEYRTQKAALLELYEDEENSE